MIKKTSKNDFLTKKEAAEYLGLPKYVLTALEKIGRLSSDGRHWFIKVYDKERLDIYIRESNVDKWRYDERLLNILKQQARK